MRPVSSGAIEMATGRLMTAGIFGALLITLVRSGLRLAVVSLEVGMRVKMGRAATSRSLVNALRCPAVIVISRTVPRRTGGAIGFGVISELFLAVPTAAHLMSF